ncbi:hypothetical protein QQS21_000710 [Conoideocrella luteorostrata]|uniref:Uncharacterized protein n=1 Tax=Conoideocrella luteorostrata TaxID=1105319 RepID=A0AAJ0CY86_9HYPO|nr:hypothetical protein QQS21_000710 [Conoideocrella luteorostrata]
MDVEQILNIPGGEIAFLYPSDAPVDRIDRRFTTLRVPRRGLREWSSFEEDPIYLREFMKLPTCCPAGWKPPVVRWTRYLASETNMVDFLKSTLMLRLNIALNAISPGLSIIGTSKHFNSYGADDNRIEGAPEVHIGPDLPVVDGDLASPPDIADLQYHTLTFGDAKVKHLTRSRDRAKILPGTIGCYESWLAQAVQCCIDLDISVGWVQTNLEVVMFHLVRCEDTASQKSSVTTRSSRNLFLSKLETLPSDDTQEPDFSSPLAREAHDWLNFKNGDEEIPFINCNDVINQEWATPKLSSRITLPSPITPLRVAELSSSPLGAKRQRDCSLEGRRDSRDQRQTSHLSPPSMEPSTRPDEPGVVEFPSSSSQIGTVSPSVYDADLRAEDVSHVLILSCPLTDKDVGRRLLELIMLAKRAKDSGALGIGPWKLSHSALDNLKAASSP